LGGIPTSNPSKIEEILRVKFEVEDKINLRSMVDHDLEAEKRSLEKSEKSLSLLMKIKTMPRSIS